MVENEFEASIARYLFWVVALLTFVISVLVINQVNYDFERGQGFKQEEVFVKHEDIHTNTDILRANIMNRIIQDN